MGSLVVPVKELLSEPQLVLDKWLHLDGASPESEILLRAELKVNDCMHMHRLMLLRLTQRLSGRLMVADP